MREFLRYLCLGKYDNRPILNALIQNISSSNEKVSGFQPSLDYLTLHSGAESIGWDILAVCVLSGYSRLCGVEY